MIIVAVILAGICLSAGGYLLAAHVFRIPALSAQSAAAKMTMYMSKKKTLTEKITASSVSFLVKIVRLSSPKRAEIARKLEAAEIDISPELYTAQSLSKALIVLVAVIPMMLIFPLGCLVIIAISVGSFFAEQKRADNLIEKKRSAAEAELPVLARYCAQFFETDRDVLRMLERYEKQAAGSEFKKELSKVTADAKTGTLEGALMRWESAVGSPMLSDLIRGLLGVVQGDTTFVYFEVLAQDFRVREVTRLKMLAKKKPDKLRKYTGMLLALFVATIFTVLILQVLVSVSEIGFLS
jgi:hypothetical protein